MTKGVNSWQKLVADFQSRPLVYILSAALLFRLIAVFFARGYLMHDDHFLTIEPSGSWAAGKNFNHWLPGIGNNNPHPEPISFFYLGGLFLAFKMLHLFGIDNPDMQMYFIRFIHALYSLLTIYYSYKITEMIGGKKAAIRVGWLLALIAILPNFSVRNLVEMVCMPPLIIGFYLLIRHVPFRSAKFFGNEFLAIGSPNLSKGKSLWGKIILAAFIMGLAVGIRYQTGLIVAMAGLMLWIFHSFRLALVFGVVSLTAFSITQADDILLWGGEPFQHLRGYFEYNKTHAGNYPGSPLAYFSFIGLFILPPVSLFLAFGFFKNWKRFALIVIPITAFLVFHILYPNRQERFILPALPFFVIVGVIGWNEWIEKSAFWLKNIRLHKILWNVFWTLNILVMVVFCFTITKKDRVEAMNYIYRQGDCRNFALEYTHSDRGAMMPQFYSGVWTGYYYWKKGDNPVDYMLNFNHDEETTVNDIQPRLEPNYYLFYDDVNLEQRVAVIKDFYPGLEYQTTIEPGWFDVMLHQLNPKNSLERIHIYKVPDLTSPQNRNN